MKHALPPLTKDLIEAFTASAVLWLMWLMGVALKLAAPHKSRRLRRWVELHERAVESILFLKAVHRFGPAPRAPRFPRGAPIGFRRTRADRRRRLFFRNSGICARKAGLNERMARLMAALANPEPFVAYFFKRLCNGLHGARLIAVAPPAQALEGKAACNVSFADSS